MNTHRYERLLARRELLEAAYGGPLSFEPLEDRKGCRIGEFRPGAIGDRSEWPAFIAWFADGQSRLRHAVDTTGGIPAEGLG